MITEDHYVRQVLYSEGSHTLDRETVGTRYVAVGLRILVDPNDPAGLSAVHALQDGVTVSQDSVGTFEVPDWDPVSQKQVRDALIALFATLPDSSGMFGPEGAVDPVRRLIGSAAAWGGNPEADALYLTVNPVANDGATVHRLTVGEVPVDAFWSVTAYNADGYFTPNAANAYSVNSVTAVRGYDGTVNDPVRRLRRHGCELSARHAGLELSGAAVPAALGDPRRLLGVPGRPAGVTGRNRQGTCR